MKLKVCGMKMNTEQVAVLQPDYLGFIFWEPSARYFNQAMPELPGKPEKVGVFVDAPLEDVLLQVYEHELDLVQLHGEEDIEYCQSLQRILQMGNNKEMKIIKAFAVDDQFDFDKIRSYESVCDYFLFDTKSDLPGGSGKSFDWKLLESYPSEKEFFLSGGIGLEDIAALKEFLNSPAARYCHAIDINSRFETEPGKKDIEKLERFIVSMGFEAPKN